jgi:putative ABC transport system substrate-binding protein
LISRRSFIAGALSVASSPLVAEAQGTGDVKTIGFLTERSLAPSYIDALRSALSGRGWVEGQSLRIEQRSAEGNLERLPGRAAELISLGVVLIVTGIGTPAALAAKRTTAKIPIVFVTGGDPVDFGIVSNRIKPGGNITGFGGGISAIQKRIELLRDATPRVKQVAFLLNLTNPIHPRIFSATEKAARQLGLTLHEIGLFDAKEFEEAFKTMQSTRMDALFVPGDAMFSRHRADLVSMTLKARLPAIYGDRLFPDAGGLMSFSVDLVELCRRAAGHVDKILRGARAGDLPVEEALKFEVIINLKTVKALGLAIPPSLLQRADEILQ